MKKLTTLFAGVVALSLLPTSVQALDLYVAPNGDDGNSGAIGSPLKTMEGAKTKLQGVNRNQTIRVNFRAGTYPATNQAVFRARDSGNASNPIIYRSMPGETAFFDGLQTVDSSKFTKVTGNLRGRMPSAARDKVYSQVITSQAMKDLLLDPHAIFSMNNRPMSLATTPNVGFLTVRQKTKFGTGKGTLDAPRGDNFNTVETNVDFPLLARELNRKAGQAYTDGYLDTEYARKRVPIARLGGTGSSVFVMKDISGSGFRTVAVSRFRVVNMLGALDAPGEWFYDRLDSRLYFWPIGDTISNSDRIGVTGGGNVISVVEGTSHLSFRNFVFRNVGGSGTGVVFMRGASNIEVAGCTFTSTTLTQAPFNIAGGCTDCVVRSCDIYDTGRGAILNGGSFNATSATHGRNIVENCHFTTWRLRHNPGNAISIVGAGNIFRNNVCHNSGTQAIIHRGIDHQVVLNEVFNVGFEEGDGGGSYTGAEIFSFGNIFRYNFTHHLISVPGLLGRAGVFSDDYDGGETYDANVFYKCGEAAIKMNAGSGHTVTANVLLNNLNGVSLLGRPETFNRINDEALRLLRVDPNNTSKPNYLGRAERVIGDFANNSNGSYNRSWDNSFWAQRYPTLRNMLAGGRLGMFPSQVRVYDNGFMGNARNFSHTDGFGTELRSKTLSNGNFVDPANLNFKFRSVPSGMKAIPFERIGLSTDAYRKSVPNKNTYRRAVANRWSSSNSRPGGRYTSGAANSLVYFNSGELIIGQTQSGLEVRQGDATKNATGGGLTPPPPVDPTITVDTSQTRYDYDLGTPDSPVQSGAWVRISPDTTGDVSWSGSTSSLDRGAGGGVNNINRDIIFSSATRILRHKLSNGVWRVHLNMGDKSAAHNQMRVRAEGTQVVRNNINNAAGVYTAVIFDVTITDGRLDLEFSDQGGSDPNWVITRMSLIRQGNVPAPVTPAQSPLGGSARSLNSSALLQVEDYDVGGQDIAYNDADPANRGGQGRTGEGVDLANASDTGGGLCIGWTQNAEWTEYTVNIAAGTYNVELRTAAQPANPGGLQMSLNGTNLGTVDVTNSGGWQTWKTDTLNNVTVPAATNGILRLTVVDGANYNINWIKFVPVSSGGGNPPPPPEPVTPPDPVTPPPADGATSLTGADIGNTSPTGSTQNTSAGSYTLRGAGADIWGAADAFHFASDPVIGSTGAATVRVASLTNTNSWAKAGVHYRDTNAAGAKNVGVYVRPDGQVAMQWRSATNGGSSWHGTLLGGTGFAKWLRLTKDGNSYTGAWSPNGTTWTDIRTVTVNMGNDNTIGLAITSHSNGTLGTAEFTNFSHSWANSGGSTASSGNTGGNSSGGNSGGNNTGGGNTGGGNTGGGSTGGENNGGGSTGDGNSDPDPTPPTGGTAQTVNATPSDDAYLRDGSRRYNGSSIRIDNGSRKREIYLKFNVTGVNGTVSGAKLILKVGDDAGNGTIRIHQGTSNSWTEGNLSSSNAPDKGTLLGSKTGSFPKGSTQEFDLNGITGNGVISLIVTIDAGGNDVKFSSKDGDTAPKLEVTSQ